MWWRKKGKWGLPVQYEEGFEHGAAWMLSVVANAFEDSGEIVSWFQNWQENLEGSHEKYREGILHIQEWLQGYRR